MQGKESILLAVAAVIFTALAVWFQQRPETPKSTTWKDVLAQAEAGRYRIIETRDLAKRYLENPSKLLLVDTRQEWEYRTGHIKGAVNFPMEPTWWARWRKAGDLEALLEKNPERDVVFY